LLRTKLNHKYLIFPPRQHPNLSQVQSIFDSLNLSPASKCVLHYTIIDPAAPPPPPRAPAPKRGRSSPPAESKAKSTNQFRQSPSSAPAHSSTPHTAPKRKRATTAASATASSPNAPSSSSAQTSSAATRPDAHRYPSPPRDIFSGGYGSGGTVHPLHPPSSHFFTIRTSRVCIGVIDACLQVGGSPNGAFAFDGDCEFQVTREA
jgi:hypothetical protein